MPKISAILKMMKFGGSCTHSPCRSGLNFACEMVYPRHTLSGQISRKNIKVFDRNFNFVCSRTHFFTDRDHLLHAKVDRGRCILMWHSRFYLDRFGRLCISLMCCQKPPRYRNFAMAIFEISGLLYHPFTDGAKFGTREWTDGPTPNLPLIGSI